MLVVWTLDVRIKIHLGINSEFFFFFFFNINFHFVKKISKYIWYIKMITKWRAIVGNRVFASLSAALFPSLLIH